MIRHFNRYFRSRWERFYLKNHWHLVLDLSLIMVTIILAASLFFLFFFRPALPGLGGFVRPPVDLNNPPLEVTFTPSESTAKTGEPVVVVVRLKNGGSVTVNDVIVSLKPTTEGYSLDRLEEQVDSPGASVKGSSIIFQGILPHSEEELSFLAYIRQKNTDTRTLKWQAQIEYILNGQQFKFSTDLANIHLAAELSASAVVYYTSPQGDQLGIGPIPPIVGIPTNYWVFWSVQGNGDFSDLSLSARLPRGVELTGQRSLLAGELNYNPDSRQLIWKIPELQVADGASRLRFEIQLVPAESQVGVSPVLVEAGRYFATDKLTGEEVAGRLPDLTTELKEDRFNADQGEVIAE